MALVAKKTLFLNGVIAAQKGNVVPADSVARYGWDRDVEDDGTAVIAVDANEDEAAEGATRARGRKRKS